MRKWRIEDSEELYNIQGWGAGYFRVNEHGHVVVTPTRDPEHAIDLKEVIDDLNLKDISCPILMRFPDILDDRIEQIAECFKNASKEYGFKGNYHTVYPIKVNQDKSVVEEIARYGKKFNLGLEAGSKPELHAVLAVIDDPDALIVCNGYKDEDFIELALLASKMGKKVFIVVEKFNELRLTLKLAKNHQIEPHLGIRLKLAASGSGKWEDSGGDQSKFGLTPNELMEAINYLMSEDKLHCLELIHCHLGSQITNIRKIKNALRETAQFFVQMNKLGCNVRYVDIGGGLGIDYDGTRSTVSSSMNYSVQEYANDAVSALYDAAEKNGLEHPHIITESGRAITAHHAVLVFNVLEATAPPRTLYEEFKPEPDDHELVKDMCTVFETLSDITLFEAWHDALQLREEALDLFSLGILDLKGRSKIELLFWSIAYEVRDLAKNAKHLLEESNQLDKLLASKYFCNFSIFQSVPDSWAIDQLFPIMPLHRLDEKPTERATIQDITCDSDGKIDRFIGLRTFNSTLPLHHLKTYENYYLGAFIVGAYQEILGDMHNLFGDTNAVHLTLNKDGTYEVDKIIEGETISDVLAYVNYNAKKLVRTMESWVSASVKSGKITVKEGKEFLALYRSGLYGYTYLED
ncbi:MAG: biosynthetic arginine decarboxylase [Candidatus Riflebacteria bacterium]|nr:biosynthetic arginine decarboxylase [Candidatus Riflebacteria bacterium]